MTGTVGQARVPKQFLAGTRLLLPPPDVQSALIGFMDSVSAAVGRTDERLAVARARVSRFRQVVLSHACAGALTSEWRNAHPDAEPAVLRNRDGKRGRGRAARHLVDELALPDLPPTYVVASLGDLATSIDYGTSRRATTTRQEGDVPVLRMGNIQDGAISFDDLKFISLDSEINGLLLQDGDLLFNRTNSPELVGKAAVFSGDEPTTFASYLIRARFCPELVLPEFVNYWINSAWGRAWAHLVKTDGVSQSNINGSKLAEMPVPVPPFDEQRAVVERASRMLHQADRVLARIEQAMREARTMREALVGKALRGEVTLAPPAVARMTA